jgi:hypothetical protein
MQSSSRTLPFKQALAGASPATDAISICDFGSTIYERAANPQSVAVSVVTRKS